MCADSYGKANRTTFATHQMSTHIHTQKKKTFISSVCTIACISYMRMYGDACTSCEPSTKTHVIMIIVSTYYYYYHYDLLVHTIDGTANYIFALEIIIIIVEIIIMGCSVLFGTNVNAIGPCTTVHTADGTLCDV